MDKWNKTRTEINKFFKLKNGQWLKIIFSYESKKNIWFMTIVATNSKRRCNDCIRKTEHSPKVIYGHNTGNRCGIEPFVIALRELLKFESTIHNTQINIVGASDRLNNIYKYLKRYRYIQYNYIKNDKQVNLMYKQIK